jgi:hypothetical protein
MAKYTAAYTVEYANGNSVSFTRAQPNQAKHVDNYPGTKYFLEGLEVEPETWYSIVAEDCEKRLAKRLLTHKQIRCLHGASAGNFVTKWIRK